MVSLKLGRAPFIGWKDKTPLLSEGFLREFKLMARACVEGHISDETSTV
jgi:hypothetical protein